MTASDPIAADLAMRQLLRGHRISGRPGLPNSGRRRLGILEPASRSMQRLSLSDPLSGGQPLANG